MAYCQILRDNIGEYSVVPKDFILNVCLFKGVAVAQQKTDGQSVQYLQHHDNVGL